MVSMMVACFACFCAGILVGCLATLIVVNN